MNLNRAIEACFRSENNMVDRTQRDRIGRLLRIAYPTLAADLLAEAITRVGQECGYGCATRTLDVLRRTILGMEGAHRCGECHGPAQCDSQARCIAPCCDLHGRNCEPPGDLCCEDCAEAAHDFTGFRTGTHADGTICAAPDLSSGRR